MRKMIKIVLGALVVCALLCFCAGCIGENSPQGLTITNSDGTKVSLEKTPERIVLLNSNAGEILYLLGDADKIIGISQSIANNAEQAKMYSGAKVVGAWNEPDVEYLISLKADLVIGYATSKPKNAEVLQSAGIPIVYIDCTKPNTMRQDIVEVGKISGNTKKAGDIAEFYDDVMNRIATRASSVSYTPSVYAESYTAYYGQGTDTGMGQILKIVGGSNIMSDEGSLKVSDEWVIGSNPDIIIKIINNPANPQAQLDAVTERPGFDKVNAVKNNKTSLIRNDLTYGPRSCAGAAAVANIIHPGITGDITAEGVLKEFNERFGTDFDTGNIVYP